jgi:phosphatidylserine/phosphatidylglycerophosphate/cardiolipin synthase-like enzyme
MNSEEFARFLRQTLDDRKLSTSEKHSLSAWLSKNVVTDQQRGVARHLAFELAKQTVGTGEAAAVIGWIEDVMRVLAPMSPQNTASAPGSSSSDDLVVFSPGEKCLQQIIHRIGQCRKTADLCVFTITDDRIARAILDCHRRGVKVRIISDNDKALDPGSDIQKFRDAGIPVKLDDIPAVGRSDSGGNGHMHHKFAIFDGTRLINGSYNWTRGAADMNYENIVDTGDAKQLAAFSAEFERLWNKF